MIYLLFVTLFFFSVRKLFKKYQDKKEIFWNNLICELIVQSKVVPLNKQQQDEYDLLVKRNKNEKI